MTIQNLTTGSNKALPYGAQAGVVLTTRVDCSETPLTASDKNPIFNIPAGTFVARVSANVIKVDKGASPRTFSVGDVSADTVHLAATTALTAGKSADAFGATGASGPITGITGAGKFYAAEGVINIVAQHDLTDAIIEVKALCYAM